MLNKPLPDTIVTLTGTGVPHPSPGRAGPGTLVRYGDIHLQFDAGRATVLRLEEAGTTPCRLSALFLTHVHSDHVVDLADVAMTRWLQQQHTQSGPLVVVTPEGAAATFAQEMFDIYEVDIATRTLHVQPGPPEIDLRTFPASFEPQRVWESEDGTVVVDAVGVHHEPVEDAVAYRVTTPTGVIVISGDTVVCDEVGDFSVDVDVLVHEACRTQALKEIVRGTVIEKILGYHADTVALGALAERSSVKHLLLTHLIPAPKSEAEAAGFGDDVREGGFSGQVTVGEDLTTVAVNAPREVMA